MWLWFKKRRVDKLMYWLPKLKIIDKSPVWLSKAEEFSNCSWQSYCMAVTNHWQFSCMALSLKKSLTILLFGFQKSLTIFLYGFELVNNHWQTSCMAVTNHWQMSIMALSQKVDKITGNSWQNYCNSLVFPCHQCFPSISWFSGNLWEYFLKDPYGLNQVQLNSTSLSHISI